MTILMKGKVFKDRAHLVEYPLVVEPKEDEIRCAVHVNGIVEFKSYDDKPLFNMDGFAQRFLQLAVRTGMHEFDVGILVNGNFNDSYRWVRSKNGPPQEKRDKKTGKVSPALDERDVEFILFDLPELHTMSYLDRRAHGSTVCAEAGVYDLPLRQPLMHAAKDEEAVYALYQSFRERGYEGAMAKTLSGLYARGGRTDAWLKVKPSQDARGEIIAIHEAISEDGVPLGRAGSVTVLVHEHATAEGIPEATPHGIAHELGRELWLNQDKYLTEKHFIDFAYMERDRQGGYRHPVFRRLRD